MTVARDQGGAARHSLSTKQPPRKLVPPRGRRSVSIGGSKSIGSRTLAVVLTGMGRDGLAGMPTACTMRGLKFVCQDEASSVVWGMPGYVDPGEPRRRSRGHLLRDGPTRSWQTGLAAPSRSMTSASGGFIVVVGRTRESLTSSISVQLVHDRGGHRPRRFQDLPRYGPAYAPLAEREGYDSVWRSSSKCCVRSRRTARSSRAWSKR